MDIRTPPGKAAILQWMQDVTEGLRYPERLSGHIDLIQAGEYVIGLESFLSNVQDVGWTHAEIDRYARQLQEACELANSDPHPEYLSEVRIDQFIQVFKTAAGYKTTP